MGKYLKINKNDFEIILRYLIANLDTKAEVSKPMTINGVSLQYLIIPDDQITNKKSNLDIVFKNSKLNINKPTNEMFRFGGYNLPNTVDYNKFGAAATLKEKMIELKLRFGNNKYCIIFRDSYLLLPVSLR